MNRLAWALAGVMFLLVGSGGLVSAYDVGMAVPDWPTTFGHWLFLPWHWLGQRNSVLLNQSHRAIAQLVLVFAVALAAAQWRWHARGLVRWLALAVVVVLVVSTALGGWRVLGNSVLAARVHAAVAPLILGLCTALAIAGAPGWLSEEPARQHRRTKALRFWCLGTLILAFLFTLAGVQLRHMPPNAGLPWMPFWTWTQVSLALASAIAAGVLLLLAWRYFRDCPTLLRRVAWFGCLLAGQLLAGGAEWVTCYGWPHWFSDDVFPISHTVVALGPLQVAATTVHVVLGATVLAVGVSTILWTYRVVRTPRE